MLQPGGERSCLIVLVHGFNGSGKQMESLRWVGRQELPNADIFVPTMPYGRGTGWLCMRRPGTIVADLIRQIDQLVTERQQAGGSYAEIYIVGYSLGAVLARRLVVLAFGEQKEPNGAIPAPFEPDVADCRQPRAWASSIKRLVLLAGINRGWSVSSAMDWITSFVWSTNQLIAETLLGGKPTIMAIRRGAPFLVHTRLQWLALMDPAYGPRPDLVSVQLLGTIDDLQSPDDNVDYSVDLTSPEAKASYFYIEVPCSGHRTILDMGTDSAAALKRRRCFAQALVGSREALQQSSIQRRQIEDNLPSEPDMAVTDLVFVIHGIRDKGFWTQKIARTVKILSDEQSAAPRKFASWTESYGYFAILPFVFRTTRQRKVEWLMDRYVEARARFPRATFHYVGHSNGTYLIAQALRDYPAARFKHIVFMGSVVRRDYDWNSLVAPPPDGPERVSKVLNYVATADCVVAIFPKGLQPFRWFNLGSAGHDGFKQAAESGPVHDVKYIVGGHSAGHGEPRWGEIARFIVLGEPPSMHWPPLSQRQDRLCCFLGRISPGIVALLAALICGVAASLLAYTLLIPQTPGEAVGLTLALISYVFLIYVVFTRF